MLVPAILLLAGAIVLLGVLRWGQREVQFRQTKFEVQQAALRLSDDHGPAAILEALSLAQRDLATFVQPSVIHVEAERRMTNHPRVPVSATQTGSGWLWDDLGHVVTAWHVIEGAEALEVHMADGTRRSATLIGGDPMTDIAVVKIDPGRLIPATRVSGIDIRQGDLVFAFGSPLDFRFSVTSGVVSGLGRATGTTGVARLAGFENFIQIDAPINPGSSGGPITDHQGRVMGMSTAIATDSVSGEARFAGVALAIPLDMIESVVPQLIADGAVQRGFLGVSVLDLDRSLGAARSLGGTIAGAIVILAPQDGILDRAGLQTGDIIKSAAGRVVRTDDAFVQAWNDNRGEEIELDVLRPDPQGHTIGSVTLVPEGAGADAGTLASMQSPLYDLLSARGAPARGVYVDAVSPDGPSNASGLLAGDVIVSIEGRPTDTVNQLRSIVSSITPGQIVTVRYWRHDDLGTRTMQVPLAARDEPALR